MRVESPSPMDLQALADVFQMADETSMGLW